MKIFEKCIRQELSNACDELFDPRQHGFINAKSCTTQMVRFTYDLSSIYMSVSYEELGKSGKKLEKVGTIGKKSFI